MTADIPETSEFVNLPFGKLGIIAMKGTEELADKIDRYIVKWRDENVNINNNSALNIDGYLKDSYIINYEAPRFGTGEAKAVLSQSVRGYDIFIIMDAFNYSIKYKMYGQEVPMSPDDHYCDLKRIISAVSGKARRITVLMPMLYEGRQHRRSARESLDCALALQELVSMGVDSVITFDAHDPRVGNAIPQSSLENVSPIYQMIKALIKNQPDIRLDNDHLLVVSPDEGGMGRAIRYASALGVELGSFYKRRDYSRVVNGRNPILAHEFLGTDLKGKDVIVVDDMIASGESMLEVAKKLKELGANKIYVCCAFGLFTSGVEIFDEAYNSGLFERILTTNCIYRRPELASREWYVEVEMGKYMAYLVDALNHEVSIGPLLDPNNKINMILEKHEAALAEKDPQQMEINF